MNPHTITLNSELIVGAECPCGVSFQHYHRNGEGLKSPISVTDLTDEDRENLKIKTFEEINRDDILDSLCLEGKITEGHAKDIKEILKGERNRLIHQIREETKDRILKSLPEILITSSEWDSGYDKAIEDIKLIIKNLN